LALLFLAACGSDAERPIGFLEDGSRPNVLVYLVDTLRADHLGCYGYPRPTSPQVDAFAEECVFFERGTTQTSWTKPSVGTLFTGMLPTNHGAMRREHALRPDVPTLAQTMKAAGYATGAVVTNPNVLPVYGFSAGFDDYVDLESMGRRTRAETVHEAAFEWLDEHQGEPFFLYLHARDPHDPLEPPEPWRERFLPKQVPDDELKAEVYTRVGLYDGEIAYWDDEMGKLFAELKARGLYDNTIIVLLSDHGEEFADHGQYGHGATLYQEQLHVPLMMRLPGGKLASQVEAPVRVVDIGPSLCELLGLELPRPTDGISFVDAILGREGYAPILYAELNHDSHLISSYSDGRYKFVRREARGDHKSGTQLFDLQDDPHERKDLSEERPDIARKFSEELSVIESALNYGFYLEVCNGIELEDAHTASGWLEVSEGTFELFDTTDLEEGDRFTLSEDRTRLEFEVQLVNEANPIDQFPRVWRDVDRARVTLSNPDAALVFNAKIDGVELSGQQMALARRGYVGAYPLTISARSPELRGTTQGHARANPVLSKNAYCRLFGIERTTPNEVEISDELDERLRALGYTGDDD